MAFVQALIEKAVLDVAVVVVGGHRDTCRDAFGKAAAHGALEFHLVVAAERELCVAVGFLRGLDGDEVGQPAGRVATVEGALGASQQFHALHVEEHEAAAGHLADVHLVEIDRHRAFDVGGEIVGGDAAHGDGVVGLAVGLHRMDAWRERGNLLGVGVAELAHLLAGDGADGDADILYVLFAFLGGDHHLFDDGRVQRRRHDECGKKGYCCSDRHACSPVHSPA